MEISREDIRGILKRDSWYAELPEALQAHLLDIGVPRQLENGERLFRRGDTTDGIYCVLDGRLTVSGRSECRDEAVQIHLEPGQWFGEIGLFDQLPQPHTVRSDLNSTVLWLNDIKLRVLLESMPEYWLHFGLLLTKQLRLTLAVLSGGMRIAS